MPRPSDLASPTLDNDGGSWDELAARAGIAPPVSKPGDVLSKDADLDAYWPAVRAVWEEHRPIHGLLELKGPTRV